jgi:hypothetical protein
MHFSKLTSLAVLAVITVTASQAQILVSGIATGRFNANAFTVLPNDTQSLLGLTFRGSTFSDTTSNGFVAFGGTPGNPNTNNFGSMQLDTNPNNYNGNTFTLRLMFQNPTVINGDFFADVLGSVSGGGGGGVTVNFGPPQTFAWSGGTFTVDVNDLNINPGLNSSITGNVQVVPEPATMATLGLATIGLIARRRRKQTRI